MRERHAAGTGLDLRRDGRTACDTRPPAVGVECPARVRIPAAIASFRPGWPQVHSVGRKVPPQLLDQALAGEKVPVDRLPPRIPCSAIPFQAMLCAHTGLRVLRPHPSDNSIGRPVIHDPLYPYVTRACLRGGLPKRAGRTVIDDSAAIANFHQLRYRAIGDAIALQSAEDWRSMPTVTPAIPVGDTRVLRRLAIHPRSSTLNCPCPIPARTFLLSDRSS